MNKRQERIEEAIELLKYTRSILNHLPNKKISAFSSIGMKEHFGYESTYELVEQIDKYLRQVE